MLIILSSSITSSLTLSFSFSPYIKSSYAQAPVETIKSRNLVIDLDNGIKTNAQLTLPASSTTGNGRPYPGVCLYI
jgi:uncharacterized protein